MEYLILPLVVIGFSVIIFLLLRKKEEGSSFLMLQNEINRLNEVLDSKLSQSNKAMQEQFSQSVKIVREVTQGLSNLNNTNRQVADFAKELQSLQDILKNPKQRGIVGEYFLEEMLRNVFAPSQYKMQYGFKDGKVVDAVIFVDKNRLIPIDSKFSLENYNRIIEEKDEEKRAYYEKMFTEDLKQRIDETAKYIRPDEKTLDFALMYIPAEAIYFDLLVNRIGALKSNTRDLLHYAHEKNVIVVSPTTFHAYLVTILHGLRAFEIEKSAMQIKEKVEMLGKHLLNYEEYLRKLGNNLSATVGNYNSAYKEFGKIDKDVIKITEGRVSVEVKELEKPNIE